MGAGVSRSQPAKISSLCRDASGALMAEFIARSKQSLGFPSLTKTQKYSLICRCADSWARKNHEKRDMSFDSDFLGLWPEVRRTHPEKKNMVSFWFEFHSPRRDRRARDIWISLSEKREKRQECMNSKFVIVLHLMVYFFLFLLPPPFFSEF